MGFFLKNSNMGLLNIIMMGNPIFVLASWIEKVL